MKYKVRSINGQLVTVDYEDGTWATAQVKDTLEASDIDKIFGQYTAEYALSKDSTTKIVVGEERVTDDPFPNIQQEDSTPQPVDDPFTFNLGAGSTYADPIVMILLSFYLADKGQNELKECLDAKLQTIIEDPEFSVTTFIEKLNETL